ncbi:MAG TPA: glutamine synthetase family protein [Thermomicrobiales bacterium]|nr:glutamine synthetase family protein [Thermomicrobiales bacterium]
MARVAGHLAASQLDRDPEAIHAAIDRIAEHEVRLIDLQFSDIAGGIKALTIPVNLVESTFRRGYRFDGAALSGGRRQVELDLFLAPDPGTLTILPPYDREPRRAQLFCWVLRRDGQPFAGDPRSALQRQLEHAADRGFDYTAGIEMEFYLLSNSDLASTSPLPAADAAGYFDVGEDVLTSTRNEIVDTLATMGIGVGGAHHETGPGQQELDLFPTGGIAIADQIVTTRQVIRTMARRRNLRATFMPKPFPDAPGSGMHVFQQMASLDSGADLLRDGAAADDISDLARRVIAGLLGHAPGMSIIANTTVNSYKRLEAGHRAPRHASWARVSQASLIRVPSALEGAQADIELRSPDAMTNPYLLFASALGAALAGIDEGEEPTSPLDELLVQYDDDEFNRLGVPRLPTTFGEALDTFAADDVIRESVGSYIADQLLHVKKAEWLAYKSHVSPWEHLRYGDL